jgi:hypothetical protein
MRLPAIALLVLLSGGTAAGAQTADDLIARYVKTIGGMQRIDSARTIRRVGKYVGGGGFEADVVQENKRGGMLRTEFSLQGMTQVTAYDGKAGWKIDPFGGKKDAESLSEEEMHGVLIDSDFDEPLINYRAKGSKAEFIGMDQFEGTDVYKVKLTLRNGDVRTYFLDIDSYVPIKIEETQMIRGSAREMETTLGDYKPVSGWYVPYALEMGMKGQDKQKITFSRIELNVPIDDGRFVRPPLAAAKKPEPPPTKPIPDEED